MVVCFVCSIRSNPCAPAATVGVCGQQAGESPRLAASRNSCVSPASYFPCSVVSRALGWGGTGAMEPGLP